MAKKNTPEEPETTPAEGEAEESSEPRITEGGESQTYKMEWCPGIGKSDNVCIGKVKYKARPDGSFAVAAAHVPDLQRAGLRVVY